MKLLRKLYYLIEPTYLKVWTGYTSQGMQKLNHEIENKEVKDQEVKSKKKSVPESEFRVSQT